MDSLGDINTLFGLFQDYYEFLLIPWLVVFIVGLEWSYSTGQKKIYSAMFLDVDDSGHILVSKDSDVLTLTLLDTIMPSGSSELLKERKEFIKRFFKNEEVTYDRYRKHEGKRYARVFNNRKADLSIELIKNGYALTELSDPDIRYFQKGAARKKKGLWSDPRGNSLSKYARSWE